MLAGIHINAPVRPASSMIKLMRTTNLILLIFVGFATLFSFANIKYSNSAQAGGAVFGIILILSFNLVPLYALSRDSTLRRLRFAKRYAFVSLLLALVIMIIASASGEHFDMPILLALALVYGLPCGLNFFAFDKKIQEIRTRAEQPASDPAWQTASTSKYEVISVKEDIRNKVSYILAHWRGEMSLARSYWINGLFIGHIFVGMAGVFLGSILEKSGASLRVMAGSFIVSFCIAYLIWLWAMVGLARSAARHQSRGGSGLVAVLAQLSVGFSILVMVVKLFNSQIPQLQEFFLIASGNDSMAKVKITRSVKGDMLALRGTLGEGSSDSFVEFIKTSPQVNTVILNSPGGRLLEAQKIADLLKTKGLDTYVEEQCASACTYIFLAGKDRAATPNAQIGFHQPNFPGVHGREKEQATQAMLNRYRQASLPEQFIERIGRTSSDDMWYPSREELLEAGVITRTSLGGEASVTVYSGMDTREEIMETLRKARVWRLYEQRHPGKMDEVADLIWKMKQQGAKQQDLQNAVQSLIKQEYTGALKTAPDALLAEYGNLLVDELKAASDISAEACAKLVKGQLDIHRTLPPNLIMRDRELMEKVISTKEHGKSYSMRTPEFASAATRLMNNMTPLHKKITEDLSAFDKQPALQCEAVTALYQNIQRLNEKDRHVVLSGLVQAK